MIYVKRYNVDFEVFCDPKKMTPESAYTLGLLWSDGHVSKTSTYVSITGVSEDLDLLKPFVFVGGEWGIYNRQQTPNRKPQTTLGISNKKFHTFLTSMDFLSKSVSSAEKILQLIPQRLRTFWWRGYFDGDGCIYTNKNYQCFFTGALESDWSFLRFLPVSLKWKHIKKERDSGNYSRMLLARKNEILLFGDYVYGSYEQDRIGLQRKYLKFQELSSREHKFRGSGVTPQKGRWVARFRFKRETYYLGYFNDQLSAENAVTEKRKELTEVEGLRED